MTEDRMALVELAEKYVDGDLLRELGQLVLQRLMEAEADTGGNYLDARRPSGSSAAQLGFDGYPLAPF